MITESGDSTIENWDTGSKEMISLHRNITKCKGVYGTRFSGSGFKGCCFALIDPQYESQILERVEKEYINLYPM